MALRQIVKDPDPILRKVCKPVTNFDEKLGILLDDMRETMKKADGVGLAAPQIGLLRRIAVVEVDDIYLELVNPIITKTKGEQIGMEACLSVSDFSCEVKRPYMVMIKAQDRHGDVIEFEVEGFIAVACCHELDHLDGVLFKDKEYKE